MKIRLVTTLFAILALSLSAASAGKTIKFIELPEKVIASINKAFPEFEVDKVKINDKRGEKTYQVRGEYEDYKIELKLDANGKVLDIKKERNDDKDDDDDNDDDKK